MTYEAILDFWKKQNIKNADELASVLSSYSVNFAYNSGKIENDEITYHDTRLHTPAQRRLYLKFRMQRQPMKECYQHLTIDK